MTKTATQTNNTEEFQGFSTEALAFFAAVRFNNSREFMNENREIFERAVKRPLVLLAEQLAPTAQAIDPQIDPRPARAVSRIWRDVRFSRDKSPLRDHMWISFNPVGETKGDSCCFYFQITADSAGWGCGFWQMRPESMENLRRILREKPAYVKNIVSAPNFAAQYEIRGESYQRQHQPPEGMDAALGEIYRRKCVFCEHSVENLDELARPELARQIAEGFRTAAPLYRLLRACAENTPIDSLPAL